MAASFKCAPVTRPGVLMVTGAYYPEISGAGLQCRELVRTLRDRVTFTVLTTSTDPSLPVVGEVDGTSVYRVAVDVSRFGSRIRAGLCIARLFVHLRPRFQIVHLHGFSRKTLLLIFLAHCFRKRVIQKLTSAGHDDPLSIRDRGWLSYRLYKTADRFLAPSPRLAELSLASGLPADRLLEVPNGVDTDRFRPPAQGEREMVRRALGFPPEAFLILFVGFFSREKQPDALFAAWNRVRREIALPSGLVFVGATRSRYYEVDRTLADKIRREAAELGIEKDLYFYERTLAIDQYYRAADCFVLPSIREGLPNALLEAMATGLPCVASKLQGVTDVVIDHGINGFLVPPGDVAALEGALRLVLQDPTRAQELGRKARETVEERYSIQQTASRMLEAYEHLTEESGSMR